MIFNFYKKQHHTVVKEKAINAKQEQLNRKMDKDIRSLRELNRILDNGVTLEIKKGLGGKHV